MKCLGKNIQKNSLWNNGFKRKLKFSHTSTIWEGFIKKLVGWVLGSHGEMGMDRECFWGSNHLLGVNIFISSLWN